ncbi:hypothetical protein K443DRAFT_445478 [Laccaria amethystina LaAM-08-1]|jgi:hypothetical protein|uniref:Uncharacterized protein n=1 Tax=Laccaria amethystina LaAM-08-1 TaxID=1095629 RepID=A0A0C9WUH2_9AGAR|nr:hypothetical protein K443DRAFT_445478 [Laccaria amethystina LaAM-08-1]
MLTISPNSHSGPLPWVHIVGKYQEDLGPFGYKQIDRVYLGTIQRQVLSGPFAFFQGSPLAGSQMTVCSRPRIRWLGVFGSPTQNLQGGFLHFFLDTPTADVWFAFPPELAVASRLNSSGG